MNVFISQLFYKQLIVNFEFLFEVEKPEHETPSSQVAPVNTLYSSPTLATTIAPTNPVIPHYYSVPPHPNVMYPPHIPPTASNGLYQVQP